MNNIELSINEFIDSQINADEKKRFLSQINDLRTIILKYPKIRSYAYISDLTHQYYSKLDDVRYIMHQKLYLLLLIKDSINKLKSTNYPECVNENYLQYYEKTAGNIIGDKLAKQSYEYKHDRFLKMQSLCMLFTIPIRPFILDKDKLPLKFLQYGNIKQFFKGSYFILFKFKGTTPFYKTHTSIFDFELMKAFNEEGWRNAFLNLSILIKQQKDIKGVCGTSWFIDPILKNISPEISFINNTLTEIGAYFFQHNTNEEAIKDALFLNPKRKKLYDSGNYKPRKYMFVITRKKLIKWSETKN